MAREKRKDKICKREERSEKKRQRITHKKERGGNKGGGVER